MNNTLCRPLAYPCNRRAFTLIELLAVIAIIGVLAGMIIVGSSKAREAAHRATCVSNLRQIGAAAYLYAQDNKGKFPETSQYNYGRRGGAGLINRLDPYIQNNNKIFYCTAYTLPLATTSAIGNHTYDVQAAKPAGDSTRFEYIGYFWTVSNGGGWSPDLPQLVTGDPRRVLAACIYFWPSLVKPHGDRLNFLHADASVESRSEKKDIWGNIDRPTLTFKP